MAVAIPIALAAVSMAASIYGGVQAKDAAKSEASLLKDQGVLAQQEANAEAERHADEVREFAKTQKLSFLKNGVTLQGSPLLVVDRTFTLGQEEVDAIRRRGLAQQTLYNRTAEVTANRGRAALVAGFSQAAATGASSIFSMSKSGTAATGATK